MTLFYIRWKPTSDDTGALYGGTSTGSLGPLNDMTVPSGDFSFYVSNDLSQLEPSEGSSQGEIVDYVTVLSDDYKRGFKLVGTTASYADNEGLGTAPLTVQASKLISDDPKIKVNHSPGVTVDCTLEWTGNQWIFSGNGAPTDGSCTFEVKAETVKVYIINRDDGTRSGVYGRSQYTNVGHIYGVADGGPDEPAYTVQLEPQSGEVEYTVNVFRPVGDPATLYVPS